MEKLFFSIIVPAHNEARYVKNTLEHLKNLNYPADKFEIIVVENGSSDNTLELAKRFENENTRVLQSGKGVSRAKNLGIDHLSPKSDWVIFLDADTILEKDFLNELNAYLSNKNGFTVGTVSVRPMPETIVAKLWFGLYNFSRLFTKTSQSIKIVKRSLFPTIRFDESLVAGEDIHLIRKARRFGRFFFMRTRNVYTSTRRFEKLGWWHVFFIWTFGILLPMSSQRRRIYEAIR